MLIDISKVAPNMERITNMRSTLSRLIATTLALVLSMHVCSAASLSKEKSPLLKEETAQIDSQKGTSNRTPSLPSERSFKLNAGVTQEYVLGPGDVMSVTDLASEDDKPASSLSPVLPDGTAVINYAGVINAAGMSLREINELVNDRAKKWFVNPNIIVNLATQRSTQVYLLGEVQHPGLYAPETKGAEMNQEESGGSSSGSDGGGGDAKPAKLPVSPGIFTLAGALELAGGLKDTADLRHIHVTRLHPKQVIDIDLWKLMLDGDVSEDLVLQPGDVVYVPRGGSDFNPTDFGKTVNSHPKVRVVGAVKSPGLYVMASDDDLLSVLARAGGLLPTAQSKYVMLARTNRDGTVTSERVNVKDSIKKGSALGRMKVHPGDVIVVDNSIPKQAAYATGRVVPNMLMYGMMMFMMKP